MRISKKLTKADIASALTAVGQSEYEIGHLGSPGLCLRVRKTGVTWSLRGRLGNKQSTWRMADAGRLSVKEAEELAFEARKLLARGVDPKEMLREAENGGPVMRTFTEADGWTWETALEKYLADVLATKSAATYKDYRITLNSADFHMFKGRLVKHITANDAKVMQDAVVARGKVTQARHALALMRTFLGWVAERGGSGLSASPVGTVKRVPPPPKKHGYVPTPQEIGAMPWRLEAAPITAGTRLAALLIMLTAQRVTTVLSARRTDFEAHRMGGLWKIPPGNMKSKRWHVIPLAPATWDVVTQALALSDSPWLFPQVKSRRKGGPCDGHVSYHPVADPMHPLDPHDFRRALATHGQPLLGHTKSETKSILDHAEGESSDVTAQCYALHDGLHIKWRVMRTWETWVLDNVARHAPVPGTRLRCLILPGSANGTERKAALADTNVRPVPNVGLGQSWIDIWEEALENAETL